MAKDGLIIKDVTPDDAGKKVHWIDGNPLICGGSEDCPLCKKEKTDKLNTWLKQVPFPWAQFTEWHKRGIPRWAIGRTIREICKRCDVELVPCYMCLRRKCQDWGKEKELIGQDRACRAWYENYCTDFVCNREPCLIESRNRWYLKNGIRII